MKRIIIFAAALLIAGQSMASEPIYLAQTDPFLVRMPHSRADFDEMFAVITKAEPGETVVGGMTQWVSDLAHNESQTLTAANPPINGISRMISWSGHGWTAVVRDNGSVAEFSRDHYGDFNMHPAVNAW
jgi:hypothetical protein